MSKKLLSLALVLLVTTGAGCAFFERVPPGGIDRPVDDDETTATNFEECVAKGNPVMESYPRQCRDNGILFVEEIDEEENIDEDEGNAEEKEDLIRVDDIEDGDQVSSPLTVTGEARGYWYFEASFPVRLEDDNGNGIATGIATAQDEWMTEEFVPFTTTLTFVAPAASEGWLVLQKDNPSGLPENDDELRIRVTF